MLYIVLLGLIVVFILLVIYWYGKKCDDEDCEYVIVLGAGLYGDRLSSSLKRRLDAAFHYANQKEMPVIVSGGQGRHESVSEAFAMKQYLCKKGMSEERIVMEDASTSTYTNFINSAKYMHAHAKIMIVTCDFHMFRAVLIGKKCGYECYRYPAKSKGIKQIKYYIREVGCLLKWLIIQR